MDAPAHHDPDTWTDLGQIDPILDEMIKSNNQAQLAKSPDIATIVPTRAAWNPRFRALEDKFLASANGTVTREEISLPRRDGGCSRGLLYRPTGNSDSVHDEGRPLFVMIHGGGFVYGIPEMEAPNVVRAVQTYGCVALSLSYRLAPEHKYPTATEDCWDALKWIAENEAVLGADLSKGFILGGTSAGGNIAIVLSHLARDESLSPPLTGLYLNVPLVLAPEAVKPEHRPLYKSREQNAHAPVLNKAFMDMYTEAYEPSDLVESYIWSPMNWSGNVGNAHAGLPPTYFQICGLDPLRDEALIYERVLRTEYGIRTMVDIYPGLPHMFAPNFPRHPSSAKYSEDSMEGIRWLLQETK